MVVSTANDFPSFWAAEIHFFFGHFAEDHVSLSQVFLFFVVLPRPPTTCSCIASWPVSTAFAGWVIWELGIGNLESHAQKHSHSKATRTVSSLPRFRPLPMSGPQYIPSLPTLHIPILIPLPTSTKLQKLPTTCRPALRPSRP